MSRVALSRAELAAMIDHTLLTPETTAADVIALCREAKDLGVWSVCVSPSLAGVAVEQLADSNVRVSVVVGFPSGAHRTEVKGQEAARAIADGADELDVVMNLGLARAGDWGGVRADLAAVRERTGDSALLKVILECAVLAPEEIVAACQAAEAAGAQFVKTSTGFHPAGGATEAAVRLLADTVGPRLGVKASGGIRSTDAALSMVAAGATRLGLSSSGAVLGGLAA